MTYREVREKIGRYVERTVSVGNLSAHLYTMEKAVINLVNSPEFKELSLTYKVESHNANPTIELLAHVGEDEVCFGYVGTNGNRLQRGNLYCRFDLTNEFGREFTDEEFSEAVKSILVRNTQLAYKRAFEIFSAKKRECDEAEFRVSELATKLDKLTSVEGKYVTRGNASIGLKVWEAYDDTPYDGYGINEGVITAIFEDHFLWKDTTHDIPDMWGEYADREEPSPKDYYGNGSVIIATTKEVCEKWLRLPERRHDAGI